jgi:hypothetical protein
LLSSSSSSSSSIPAPHLDYPRLHLPEDLPHVRDIHQVTLLVSALTGLLLLLLCQCCYLAGVHINDILYRRQLCFTPADLTGCLLDLIKVTVAAAAAAAAEEVSAVRL